MNFVNKDGKHTMVVITINPPGGYLGYFLLGMCRWHLRAPTPL